MKSIVLTFFCLALATSFAVTPVVSAKPPPPVGTNGLSDKCKAALSTIASSPDIWSYVPVVELIPLLSDPILLGVVMQDPKKSLIVLQQAGKAFSGMPADKRVIASLKLVYKRCSKDLGNEIAESLRQAIVFYSPIKDIATTTNDNSKEYCTAETWNNVLKLPESPIKITGIPLLDKFVAADSQTLCTPCNQHIVNTIFKFLDNNPNALKILEADGISNELLMTLRLDFVLKCGDSFSS